MNICDIGQKVRQNTKETEMCSHEGEKCFEKTIWNQRYDDIAIGATTF